MGLVIGVDPGLRTCGVGVVDGHSEKLLRGWLVRNPETEDDGAPAWRSMVRQVSDELAAWMRAAREYEVTLLAVERMAIRHQHGRLTTRNPATMLGLQAIGGGLLIAVSAAKVAAPYTSQWRAHFGRPTEEERETGDAQDTRILDSLDANERSRAPDAQKKSTGHNVTEAIGIAKWGARKLRQLDLFPGG